MSSLISVPGPQPGIPLGPVVSAGSKGEKPVTPTWPDFITSTLQQHPGVLCWAWSTLDGWLLFSFSCGSRSFQCCCGSSAGHGEGNQTHRWWRTLKGLLIKKSPSFRNVPVFLRADAAAGGERLQKQPPLHHQHLQEGNGELPPSTDVHIWHQRGREAETLNRK